MLFVKPFWLLSQMDDHDEPQFKKIKGENKFYELREEDDDEEEKFEPALNNSMKKPSKDEEIEKGK